jgi:hypothetical protein
MDATTTPSTERDAPTYVERTDPVERQKRHRETAHIQGWGADVDPENRPAVPKERTPPRLEGAHGHELDEWQHPPHRIHHSTERPGITPVFGTSVAPSGVSGKMRDLAFKYSENDIRHWLILLGADRVNMVEGLLEDLAHGHVPNLWKEMGLASEWRYNRKGFVTKAAVIGGVAAFAIYALRRRRSHRHWE